MPKTVEALIEKLKDPSGEEVFRYSDKLARIGGSDVIEKLIPMLYDLNEETMYLAARTLRLMTDNREALEPLLKAINDKKNKNRNGSLVEALDGFDCSDKFVEIFRLYLFGNMKTSAMAKMILDFKEFDINLRTVRKAEKQWHHFEHNTPHDEIYMQKRKEANIILKDLRALFSG